jgi:hypothetical protein
MENIGFELEYSEILDGKGYVMSTIERYLSRYYISCRFKKMG